MQTIGSSFSRWGVVGLAATLFLSPILGGFPPGADYGADAVLGALRTLALIVSAMVLFSVRRGSNSRLSRLSGGALALYGALVGISLLANSRFLSSPFLLFAMVPAALDIAAGVVVFAACRRAASDPRAREWLLWALVGGLGLLAIFAAREYGDAFRGGQPWHRSSGVFALGGLNLGFFSPNFAAGFLALTLPIAAALLAIARERLGVLLSGAALAIGLGALVSTGSRVGAAAGAFGLGIALIGALLATRGKLPWKRLAIAVGLGLVCAFGFRGALLARKPVAATAPATSVQSPDSGLVDAFRKATWSGTANMAAKNPTVGTGPGTFPYIYPRYAIVARTGLAHSSYLQTAAETGVVSLLALLAGIGLAIAAGAKRLRGKSDNGIAPDEKIILGALVGGIFAALLRQFFDSEWSLPGAQFAFFGVLGLLAASDSPRDSAQSRPIAGVLAAVLALVSVVVSAGLSGGGWPPSPVARAASGDVAGAAAIDPTPAWQFQIGRRAQAEGRYADAVAAFRSAVENDPNSSQSLRALAEAQTAAGAADDAVATWRRLIALNEGPAGKIRALSEATDTNPAFAYVAVARAETDPARAASLYETAAQIVIDYSNTAPEYQLVDFGTRATRERVVARRTELAQLYEQAVTDGAGALRKSGQPDRAQALESEKTGTIARIEKMALP